MELQGTIKHIGETQTFGNNGFQKREVVVTTEEQYPQPILVEFIKDKCAILDKYNVGQQVSISINLRGREWVNPQGETKYFNSIQGWRIGALNQASNVTPKAPVNTPEPFQMTENVKDVDKNDLPF